MIGYQAHELHLKLVIHKYYRYSNPVQFWIIIKMYCVVLIKYIHFHIIFNVKLVTL